MIEEEFVHIYGLEILQTWRIEKAFSATYFCRDVAPLCCSLSGCRHNLAFW